MREVASKDSLQPLTFSELAIRSLRSLFTQTHGIGPVASTHNFGKMKTPQSQCTYGVRNLDMSIHFSLKSRPSEGIPRPEMSQIKAENSLHTNLKLIFHKNVGWQGYQWIP